MNFNDYTINKNEFEFIIKYCNKNKIKSVIEFGPGTSTYAFLKSGINNIYSFEYDKKWYEKYKNNEDFKNVNLYMFKNVPYLNIKEVNDMKFDLAFIDSPTGGCYKNCCRLNSTLFCSYLSDYIMIHDIDRKGEKNTVKFMYDLGWREHLKFDRLIILKKDNSEYKFLPRDQREWQN